MENLGGFLINKVATLPQSEIKPQIEQNDDSAYSNYQ